MRIRIDDDFNNDLDAEYKSIDNDTIVGNGALSKENIPIVDVKSEEVKEEKIDGRTIKKEEINEIDKGYSNKIKWWLVKFRGVASKYLDHYLNWRAFEYKNSIEYTRNNSIIEKINFNINVKAEINTYLSWNKIKEKVICI